MPGYFSEIDYYGTTSQEFIEVAVPAGTDVSGYTIEVYEFDGSLLATLPIGTYQTTVAGQDVYLLPGTDFGYGDSMGALYPDDAIALIDDNGTVLQFVSWEGNTVTAAAGAASGLTSTNLGSIFDINSDSLETNDGGSSYFLQTAQNPGTIPCFASGTAISVVNGTKLVEHVREGDLLRATDGQLHPVLWTWRGSVPLDGSTDADPPVLIMPHVLAPGQPDAPLVVSSQHRIAVGVAGQLAALFDAPAFVPAKALVGIPGVRFMDWVKKVEWVHFACADHAIVLANGAAAETLLLGPVIWQALPNALRDEIAKRLDAGGAHPAINGPPALPCLRKTPVRERLFGTSVRACAQG